MTSTDYICQEKKEEEDLPALWTVLMHRYNDWKTNIEKREERLITATRNDTDNMRINRTKLTRKLKLEEKQLYGHFKQQISDIKREKTWTWLRNGNHMRESVSLRIAAQNNAIRTNHIKARIDKMQQNTRCW